MGKMFGIDSCEGAFISLITSAKVGCEFVDDWSWYSSVGITDDFDDSVEVSVSTWVYLVTVVVWVEAERCV